MTARGVLLARLAGGGDSLNIEPVPDLHASCDAVTERIVRAHRELHERTEATRLASEELVEQARQEREREIERARVRREARVN